MFIVDLEILGYALLCFFPFFFVLFIVHVLYEGFLKKNYNYNFCVYIIFLFCWLYIYCPQFCSVTIFLTAI